MWAVVGAVVPFLLVGIRSMEMWQSRSAIVAALILAAIWQLSALKRRALLQCHRTTSLSPIGLAADAACLRFGFMQGRACVASCWALMLIPMLASHSIIMMLCVQATLIGERYERRPRIRTAAAFPLLAGALAIIVI
jgi:predicted metal-binding membrane protein